MMQCSRTYFAISGLILWVLMEIGCEGSGGAWPRVADIFQPDEIVEENPTWPYWPEKMRIHPLTRVVAGETEGSLFIEARLELLDLGFERLPPCLIAADQTVAGQQPRDSAAGHGSGEQACEQTAAAAAFAGLAGRCAWACR